MHKLLNPKTILTALLATFVSATATAVPFQQIADEDVELLFTIRSLSELREQWLEHPMAEIFKDESLKELFELQGNSEEAIIKPFLEEIEDTFGLSEDEFFELFSGQVGLAIYNISDQILENERPVEFFVMAEFSGDTERLRELMQIQFERNAEMHREENPLAEHTWVEETFMGETLHFDETFDGEETHIEDGYALVDDILVLATPEARLRQAVEMIKDGAEAPLSGSEPYRRAREHSGRGDVALYINLLELMPHLNASLDELPIDSNLALLGVTPQSLKSALSLEAMEGLFWDIDLIKDGILSYGGILYSEKSGILSLFEYVEGELPEAHYVPDNVLNAFVARFDISEMYQSLKEFLSTASPQMLSMIDIQMQIVQTNTGVNLHTSLLENFGTKIVGFAVLEEDTVEWTQPQQLVVFDLRDAEAFSQALNALIDSAPFVRPMMEESKFEGETIYSIVTPGQPSTSEGAIHYTVTRSKFILSMGHVSLLHIVLSNMKNDDDGFWQDPDVLALFERIEQPNAVAQNYYDMEQLIDFVFKFLSGMNRFGGAAEQLPPTEVPKSLKGGYRFISETNENPDGLFWRVLIVNDESEE